MELGSTLHTAYLPPLAWFAEAARTGTILLEGHEHYQKGSTRNRCTIAGPNGPQRLSIPLEKGKHQQTPIREVRIAYTENWPLVHWRSIRTAYGNAPFFEYFGDDLDAIYQKRPTFLFDFNLLLLEFVLQKTKWPFGIAYTDAYRSNALSSTDAYVAKPYPQVFQDRYGFQPGLSVIDGLMCSGRELKLSPYP
jgi:hypothetical protein